MGGTPGTNQNDVEIAKIKAETDQHASDNLLKQTDQQNKTFQAMTDNSKQELADIERLRTQGQQQYVNTYGTHSGSGSGVSAV